MTEKEIGDALLKLDATRPSGGPDARQLTLKILARDRRRVRMLSGLTIAVWVLALIVILLVTIVIPLKESRWQLSRVEGSHELIEPQRREDPTQEMLNLAFQRTRDLRTDTMNALAVLTLAAACTSVLLFASRRATLREVNAGLAEISEQLKELRQSLGK